MMGQTVEKRRRHLGVAEHCRPFSEREVRGDDDRRALVEPTDQMEQELTASLGKWQIAEFVEDDEVETVEIVGRPPLLAAARFRFQPIDQIDDVEEAPACSVADQCTGNRDGEMALTGSRAADEDDVTLISDEGAGSQLSHQGFIGGRIGEVEVVDVEVVDVLGERQLGDAELVANGACLRLGDLRLQEIATMRGGSCCRLMPLPMTSS